MIFRTAILVSLLGAIALAACLVPRGKPLQTAPPVVEPFHASDIYAVGEDVGWNLKLDAGSASPWGKCSYTLKENNATLLKEGEIDLTGGTASISISVKEPAMVFLTVAPSGGGHPRTFGAAVEPTKLRPVAPRPKDFDAFWRGKVKELEAVSPNPVLTPGDSGNSQIEFDILRMDHVGGHHVYGQLAKPKRSGKFPALLILQWASPPYPLQKPWVVGPASQGWLTLNIEPHDVMPDQPQAYYNALPRELKNYNSIGWDDRDKSYFLQMYLADYRAVDYLASRPDWDGKTLVVMGTSMGGQQSLCVAGLHPKVTHVLVEEPSGCDLCAALHGRQTGYPSFPADNPKVMAAAPYFDCINFAFHIRAEALVAMGFTDTIAPPTGIWTAFNLIRGPKEAEPMTEAPHNNIATRLQQRRWDTRSADWLSALASGEKVTLVKADGLQ